VLTAAVLALVALTLTACGGDDDEEATTTPAPAEAPSEQPAAPPSSSALPPELVKCYADKGYRIESPNDVHSAPPEVVQECFGVLHQGGGTP
jgi:hypothetical protein